MSNKLNEKSKVKVGTIAKIYSIVFAKFFIDGTPLNTKTIIDPKSPKIKFNKIIAFCAFDSLSKKKLKAYVIDIIPGP